MVKTQEPSDALDKQVGGSHYKKGIQPFEISMANGHDAAVHAMNKYMTRHRRKDPEKGYEDCQKAHHIAGIRLAMIQRHGPPYVQRYRPVPIQEYVESNELGIADACAVYTIEAWYERSNVDHQKWHDHIRKLIREAARSAYPETFNEEDFV